MTPPPRSDPPLFAGFTDLQLLERLFDPFSHHYLDLITEVGKRLLNRNSAVQKSTTMPEAEFKLEIALTKYQKVAPSPENPCGWKRQHGVSFDSESLTLQDTKDMTTEALPDLQKIALGWLSKDEPAEVPPPAPTAINK